MRRRAIRGAALVVLSVLSTACGASTPTSPTVRNEPAAISGPTPPPTPTFPPLSGPSRIFTFDHELSYRVSDYTKQSRFVLYDNGAFVLEYANLPVCNCKGTYRGGYTEANRVITFEWEGWNIGGPWGATGALNGDTLTLQYNEVMALSDFEDAVYRRTQ